jgi:chemotaxis protein CheX
MTITHEPALADLQSIMDDCWSTFLGNIDPLEPVAPGGASYAWSAAITVTGGWQALVLMQFSDAAASTVASKMLGMGEDEVPVTEDLNDSLGELVNVIGGNVKSLMPGPSQLSLPLVAQGIVSASLPGRTELVESTTLDVRWLGEPVRLSISVASSDAG